MQAKLERLLDTHRFAPARFGTGPDVQSGINPHMIGRLVTLVVNRTVAVIQSHPPSCNYSTSEQTNGDGSFVGVRFLRPVAGRGCRRALLEQR